jgi:putative membrane protein
VTLLVGSACFVTFLPWEHPFLLLCCQLGLGGMGFLAARLLPDFKRTFVSDRRAQETAEEQAAQEFFGLGLYRTEGRSGILLFVSLFERRVIVLADVGIHEKVGETPWVETDRAILEGVRRGALADGLVEGIGRCADVLAEHFPWQEGDRNEIPDRVVVRRE